MADGPQRARLPIPPTATVLSCLWSQGIFLSLPGSCLMTFYRDARSALLQLVNQWLNFTYSRCHAFSATETKIQFLVFTTIELPTSALVGVRGYLLDHSGVGHLSHVNPARGHKETRRSTDHIMVTVRCSNQQGSKS